MYVYIYVYIYTCIQTEGWSQEEEEEKDEEEEEEEEEQQMSSLSGGQTFCRLVFSRFLQVPPPYCWLLHSHIPFFRIK